MLVGYARTSTLEQQAGLDAQIREFEKLCVEKIFEEKVSSVDDRPRLKEALSFVREGDVFIVTKLDRLARSIRHLLEIVDMLESKKVALKVLDPSLDTGTATGKLVLTVFGAFAEFERSMMLERQKEGIARARKDGKYKGRKPLSDEKRAEVRALTRDGFNPTQVARKAKVARRSVYRILQESNGTKVEQAQA